MRAWILLLLLTGLALAQERPLEFDIRDPQQVRVPRSAPQVLTLPVQAAARLLSRLAPLPTPIPSPAPLRRPDPVPPPRATTVAMPFPPQQPPPSPDPASLKVLSYSPRERAAEVSQVTINFSEPMVALGAQSHFPATITPQPPGRWRWLGTQMLTFQPEGRFLTSGEYAVEVPAETRSLSGAQLGAKLRWTFSAGGLRPVTTSPQNSVQPASPLIFLQFDEDVEDTLVLAHTRLTRRDCNFPLRLATSAEAAREPRTQLAPASRWVVLTPVEPLPLNSTFTVTLTGPFQATFSFDTHGPLRAGMEKAWHDAVLVGFNNPVTGPEFRFTPPVPGLKVDPIGSRWFELTGLTPHTSYQLHVTARDTFGQSLPDQVLEVLTDEVPPATPTPSPRAELELPHRQMLVLDAGLPPVIPIRNQGHHSLRMRLRKVTPADWAAFDRRDQQLPGVEVCDAAVPLTEPEARLDLTPGLTEGVGQLIVQLDAPDGQSWTGWVQVTRLSVEAFREPDRVLGWVNALADGSPQAGVELSLPGGTAVTDSAGLARLPLGKPGLLVARRGSDVAFLPRSWEGHPALSELAWYVADQQGLYRPGEEVRLRGWVRRLVYRGDLSYAHELTEVSYRVKDSRGLPIAEGKAPLAGYGGFDLRFTLPRDVGLGDTYLQLEAGGSTHEHALRVLEFRRPEFDVSVTAAPSSCLVGDTVNVTTAARYFAGGPLDQAAVAGHVTATATSWSPPGWAGFTFGDLGPDKRDEPRTFGGRTDARGLLATEVDFRGGPPQPVQVEVTADVQDLNRQTLTARTSVLVHPASLYVGLKPERSFVGPARPFPLKVAVADLDGHPVAGRPVELTWHRLDWHGNPDGPTRQQTVTEGTHQLTTGDGGLYEVVAEVRDEKGRKNRTRLSFWVAGWSGGEEDKLELTVIRDRQEYRPGDVAQVLVSCPFPAFGTLTVRRDGIVFAAPLDLTRGTATAHIPITAEHFPMVDVQVDAVGNQTRLSGGVVLSVPPRERELGVRVEPAERALRPGSEAKIKVQVSNPQGKPAGQAEVDLFVVDEAVLTLAGYQLRNPLASFYPRRQDEVLGVHLRDDQQLPLPSPTPTPAPEPEPRGRFRRSMGVTWGSQNSPGALNVTFEESVSRLDAREAPPEVRTDFRALALWSARLRTNARGEAVAKGRLPDSLTRYRVMAVVVRSEGQFGAGESSLTASVPLMVRLMPPRFLHLGDRCELPVVVQNSTDRPLKVDVALRARNLSVDDKGRRLLVAPHSRAELAFPATTQTAGSAHLQIVAQSGGLSDAAQVELPVYTPGVTEHYATYGTLDGDASVEQAVSAPAGVASDTGGLQVTTSSTALSELTDAFLYLQRYPYECTEQLSSRMLSVSALREVLGAFGVLPEAVEAGQQRDVRALEERLQACDGFRYWAGSSSSAYPFASVHAAHALVRAHQQGLSLRPTTLERCRDYLRGLRHEASAVRAYALWVRQLMGDPDPQQARELLASGDQPLEVLGWLWPLVPEVEAALAQRVTETAGTAGYGDQSYQVFWSPVRSDAVVLNSLLERRPESPLIPKLVRGLLDRRRAGRWDNTQENCFVLLALDRYFKTFEKATPDFLARVWLGDTLEGEQGFRGRTTEQATVTVPMGALQGTKPLVVGKTGPGRLYYRVALSATPVDPCPPSAKAGFSLTRVFEAVDNPADVRQDEAGVWQVKAGSRVRMRLTLHTPDRRYHVALVDPLAAGLEDVPGASGAGFDHENHRDDRVEAFESLLPSGTREFSHLARATTAGTFLVPPAHIEEMYHPEVFGRSAGDRLIVY